MTHVLAKLQESFDAEAAAYAELRAQAAREGIEEPPLLASLMLLVTLVIVLTVGAAALPASAIFS